MIVYNLANFLNWFFHLEWWIVFLVIMASFPGTMYLIGLLLENRRLEQANAGWSYMFCPGVFALGLIPAGLAILIQELDLTIEVPFVTIGLATGWLVFLFMRYDDKNGDTQRLSSKRQRNAPTKIFFDVMGYFVVIFLLTTAGSTVLWTVIAEGVRPSWDLGWILTLTSIAVFAICTKADDLTPASDKEIQDRQPADWDLSPLVKEIIRRRGYPYTTMQVEALIETTGL